MCRSQPEAAMDRLGRAGPRQPGPSREPARGTRSPRARSELAAGMLLAARGCHEPGGPERAGPAGRPPGTSHRGRVARVMAQVARTARGPYPQGRPPHKVLPEISQRSRRSQSACRKARPEARSHVRTHARTHARWPLARTRSGGRDCAPNGVDPAATTSTRSILQLERYPLPSCYLHH